MSTFFLITKTEVTSITTEIYAIRNNSESMQTHAERMFRQLGFVRPSPSDYDEEDDTYAYDKDEAVFTATVSAIENWLMLNAYGEVFCIPNHSNTGIYGTITRVPQDGVRTITVETRVETRVEVKPVLTTHALNGKDPSKSKKKKK